MTQKYTFVYDGWGAYGLNRARAEFSVMSPNVRSAYLYAEAKCSSLKKEFEHVKFTLTRKDSDYYTV